MGYEYTMLCTRKHMLLIEITSEKSLNQITYTVWFLFKHIYVYMKIDHNLITCLIWQVVPKDTHLLEGKTACPVRKQYMVKKCRQECSCSDDKMYVIFFHEIYFSCFNVHKWRISCERAKNLQQKTQEANLNNCQLVQECCPYCLLLLWIQKNQSITCQYIAKSTV